MSWSCRRPSWGTHRTNHIASDPEMRLFEKCRRAHLQSRQSDEMFQSFLAAAYWKPPSPRVGQTRKHRKHGQVGSPQGVAYLPRRCGDKA